MAYCLTAFLLFYELDFLYPDLHEALRSLIHEIPQDRIFQRFLHLGDIDDATLGQLLELLIVDIGAVHGHYVALGELCRLEHERVVCGCRREFYVGGNALVGVYDRVDFDATFLLACLGMAPYTLEQQIGEQRYCRGVDDLQPFHPFETLAALAVRGKDMAVGGVQIALD